MKIRYNFDLKRPLYNASHVFLCLIIENDLCKNYPL
jgi:hypothetical protein